MPEGRVWEGWRQTRFQSVYTFEEPAKLASAPPSSMMDPVNVTLPVRTKITPRGSAWFDLVCSLHIHQCSRCRFRIFPSHSLLVPVTRLAPSPTIRWPSDSALYLSRLVSLHPYNRSRVVFRKKKACFKRASLPDSLSHPLSHSGVSAKDDEFRRLTFLKLLVSKMAGSHIATDPYKNRVFCIFLAVSKFFVLEMRCSMSDKTRFDPESATNI